VLAIGRMPWFDVGPWLAAQLTVVDLVPDRPG
jgi:hypothetical protein